MSLPRNEENDGVARPVRRGLYSGFDAYLTPTDDDYRHVLTKGLVALDTNVLLNLYRYSATARDDLFAVLEAIRDQLFVPHQVLLEFWRNRDAVLRDPRDTAKAAQQLDADRERAISTFRTWANRVSLPDDRQKELLTALTSGFEAVTGVIDGFEDERAVEAARDTAKDEVLTRLAGLLDDCCGPALSDKEHSTAVTEGLRRVEAKIPPGYMDKNKGDETAAGDYIVWRQILEEAKHRNQDLLLVTGDVKEDWWRREAGEFRGPRPELAQELRQYNGHRLFMLRPGSLLQHAKTLLEITVKEASVASADRIDTYVSGRDISLVDGGWNTTSLTALLQWLADEYPDRSKVILAAAKAGGFVSRSDVYRIADRDEGGWLNGFVTPIRRFAAKLKAEGDLPENAVDVLRAVYGADAPKFGWATGYQIDEDVLPLFNEYGLA